MGAKRAALLSQLPLCRLVLEQPSLSGVAFALGALGGPRTLPQLGLGTTFRRQHVPQGSRLWCTAARAGGEPPPLWSAAHKPRRPRVRRHFLWF